MEFSNKHDIEQSGAATPEGKSGDTGRPYVAPRLLHLSSDETESGFTVRPYEGGDGSYVAS